jgi:very-short-patch-repair endonuclease
VQFAVSALASHIADFCAARLVVEVDGGCHAQRRAANARRDAALRTSIAHC